MNTVKNGIRMAMHAYVKANIEFVKTVRGKTASGCKYGGA